MIEGASLIAPGPPLYEQRFDESPALIWFKDLQGRYLQTNRRYTQVLETSEERLLGRTDRELPAREVVDGPRLLDGAGSASEPLQLEYTIAPFEGRPGLAVLRFPVRDLDGEPIAICGVGAPLGQAHVARAECARLMALERARREEPEPEAGTEPEPEAIPEPEAVAEPEAISEPEPDAVAEPGAAVKAPPQDLDAPEPAMEAVQQDRDELIAQRDQLAAKAADLQSELGEGRRRIAALHEASATAARRAHELMSALTQEQERSAALQTALDQAQHPDAPSSAGEEPQTELDRLGAELERLRTELEQAHSDAKQAEYELQQAHGALQRARADAQGAREQLTDAHNETAEVAKELSAERARVVELRERLSRARVPGKFDWDANAQRALAAALSGASEWRTGLKDVIKVLGAHGGWDAVCAWAPGERASLRCVAMWMRDPDLHSAFETLTWQRPEPLAATELGRANGAGHPLVVLDLQSSDDHRMKVASGEGMGLAVLVPIRDGVSTLALLELLSTEGEQPEPEVLTALDAIALQLGHFAHLLRLGARPSWRFGRV
jgi:predicted  nucleic acid-binding Zn-ribbon protein